jgi:FkbM family methyltransferase
MNQIEVTVREIKKKYGGHCPVWLDWALGKGNTFLHDICFGGIHRRLNGIIDVKLSARFRTLPEEYEPLAFRIMKEILKPGHIGVDVGANLGLYSLAMAKLVFPSGKVFSFEPASESFAALLDHIRRNGLTDMIEPYMSVIGDQSGTCIFTQDGVLGTNRIGGSKSQGKNAKAVTRMITTLDQLFSQNGLLPDLIKIDVEGYETSVLKGAQEILSKKRCPILCELHPGYWKAMTLYAENFIQITGDLGYHIFELNGALCQDFNTYKMVLLA